MEQELPSKKDVCIALLEQSVVRVFLDPRRDGVTIPAWLRKQPQLLLDVGLNMPIPIPDLHVGDDALTCTLSFNRSPFFCIVPWSSVFALVGDGDRGMIWPDDVPAELQIHAAGSPATKPPARPRPQLAAVAPPPDDEPAKPEKVAKLDRETTKAKGERKKPALHAARAQSKDGDAPKAKGSRKPSAMKAVTSKSVKPNAEGAATPSSPSLQGSPPGSKAPTAEARQTPSAGAGDATLKKKRELPPYLRVIK